MRDDPREALAIDASSSMEDRTIDITTIDITTIGRRSGGLRRIEIVFYRADGHVYLSGIPSSKPRAWLVNLAAHAQFTFHFKRRVTADLPARASVIVDPAERTRILTTFVEEFTARHGPDSPWPVAVLDEWVQHSPLAEITFLDV